MSGVQFETLVAPVCATEKPKTGSFVTYHYICRDESGNRIDSTYDENAPIHAKIGSGNIIQVRFKLRRPRIPNRPWYGFSSVTIPILKKRSVSTTGREPTSLSGTYDMLHIETHSP